MTDIETQTYYRKQFPVKATQVTAENIERLAKRYNGELITTAPNDDGTITKYIKLSVTRAANERQKKAYVGDWILAVGTSYKSYTDKAFHDAFEIRSPNPVPVDTNLNSGSGAFGAFGNMSLGEAKDAFDMITAVARIIKSTNSSERA